MKKSTCICIHFLIFIYIFSCLSFAQSTPKIYIKDAVKVFSSDTVTLDIYTENLPENICALGLDIKYDSSKLEYVNSKEGENLSATMKTAENFPSENRLAIGIVALSGLKENGHYYSITFKVLDDSSDIEVNLKLREASDFNGDDVFVNVESGKIKMLSSNDDTEEDDTNVLKNGDDFKISFFETEELQNPDSIPNILQRELSMVITYDDIFNYTVKDKNIVEILEDGTIIPNNDGSTKVRVKFNENDIGTMIFEIKDGNLKKVIGTAEILNIKEDVSKDEIIIPIIIVIIICIFVLILIKKYILGGKNEKN